MGGNHDPKGSDPHRDVMAYGASGSCETTTTAGLLQDQLIAGTSALDFVNGRKLRIVGAGSADVLTVPTGVAVTPEGTTGSAPDYTYRLIVDAK